jgi:hypothetical protein
MDFSKAISSIYEVLSNAGTKIDINNYDGIVIKKLSASNTLEENRTTNQTHIAITGEQMDVFPYLCADGYFMENNTVHGADLKKYFVISINVTLFESNCRYLGLNDDSIVFSNGKKTTNTTVVRSKRSAQADQIQVSMLNMDGKDFITFRKLLRTEYYLIILKCASSMNYHIFAIKPNIEGIVQLSLLNNKFIRRNTNTVVHSDLFNNNDFDKKTIAKGGINKIFYGAPGCGKSHHVSESLEKADVLKSNIIRATFHPEYANCDFIGQIMPTIEKNEEGKEIVKYIFNPGPFTVALLKAYNTSDMVYLIVEEINRGNAAAIFGDMFQLLDRERDSEKPNYSASEYPISNPNMQDYLIKYAKRDFIKKSLADGVFIPSNLTIYATMNSSDQNVFTLDTAFKRRWYFEQISNDILRDDKHEYKKWYIPGTDVTWETFLTKLNTKILDYKIYSQTNEDKRLGKYFVTKECLTESIEDISNVQKIAFEFAYKVLEYVWNDVCKIGREEWFETEKYKTLEELIDGFVNPKSGETPLSIFQNIEF